MPKKLIACLIVSSLALVSGPAFAREYQVEIIVFDRLNRANNEISTAEQWDFSSKRIAERLRQMSALAGKASEYETSDRVIKLEAVRASLLEQGYRILNTTRWRQPTSLYQHAPLISLGADNALVSGFVRIYTTSLIYADLALQLSPPLVAVAYPRFDDSDPTAVVDLDTVARQPHYFIAEKRRLQFKQIHYFDHPYFGAILGVWPVKTGGDSSPD